MKQQGQAGPEVDQSQSSLLLQNSMLTRELCELQERLSRYESRARNCQDLAERDSTLLSRAVFQKMQLNYRAEFLQREKEEAALFIREMQGRNAMLEAELRGKRLLEKELGEANSRLQAFQMLLGNFAEFEQEMIRANDELKSQNMKLRQEQQIQNVKLASIEKDFEVRELTIRQLRLDFDAQTKFYCGEIQALKAKHLAECDALRVDGRARLKAAHDQAAQGQQRSAIALREMESELARIREREEKLLRDSRDKDFRVSQMERKRNEDQDCIRTLRKDLNEAQNLQNQARAALQSEAGLRTQCQQNCARLVGEIEGAQRQRMVAEGNLKAASQKMAELQKIVEEKNSTIRTLSQSYRRELRELLSQSQLRRIVAEVQSRVGAVAYLAEQGHDWVKVRVLLEELASREDLAQRREISGLLQFILRIWLVLVDKLAELSKARDSCLLDKANLEGRLMKLGQDNEFLSSQVEQAIAHCRTVQQDMFKLKDRHASERRTQAEEHSAAAQKWKQAETMLRKEIERLGSSVEQGKAELQQKNDLLMELEHSLQSKSKECRVLADLIKGINGSQGRPRESVGKGLSRLQSQAQLDESRVIGRADLRKSCQGLLQKLSASRGRGRVQLQLSRREDDKPTMQLVLQLKEEYRQKYDSLVRGRLD